MIGSRSSLAYKASINVNGSEEKLPEQADSTLPEGKRDLRMLERHRGTGALAGVTSI
jgi:hypothetical protein